MASHRFQNSVQIPLSGTTDSDANIPLQTLPNTLPKNKTQRSAPKPHIVSCLGLAIHPCLKCLACTPPQLHPTSWACPGAVNDAPIWKAFSCYVRDFWASSITCVMCTNVFPYLLTCKHFKNYIHKLVDFLYPKAFSMFYIQQTLKKMLWMNQWIDLIERKIPTSDRMLWKMKVFGNSYTRKNFKISLGSLVDWKMGKLCPPLTKNLPFSSHPTPSESVTLTVLIPRSGKCIPWIKCFTFQVRAGLSSMKEPELKKGDYVIQIS